MIPVGDNSFERLVGKDDYFIDENTGRLRIRLNPRLRILFQNLNYLQADYTRILSDPELWLYMAVSKDKPGERQYRQLRDVYAKYTGKEKFNESAYKSWVSRVAKPGLTRLQQDGKIQKLRIDARKGGHVASWIVVADSWKLKAQSDDLLQPK